MMNLKQYTRKPRLLWQRVRACLEFTRLILSRKLEWGRFDHIGRMGFWLHFYIFTSLFVAIKIGEGENTDGIADAIFALFEKPLRRADMSLEYSKGDLDEALHHS